MGQHMKKIRSSKSLYRILVGKTFVSTQLERLSLIRTSQVQRWNNIRRQTYIFMRHFWPSLEVSREIKKVSAPTDPDRHGADFFGDNRKMFTNIVFTFEVESILVCLTFVQSLKILHYQYSDDFTYTMYRYSQIAFGTTRQAVAVKNVHVRPAWRLRTMLGGPVRFGSPFNVLHNPGNPQVQMWELIMSIFKEDEC